MADNYVQIRIKATDTAKPDLTSLKADLDDLGNKVDTAKVDVDDTDAKRKLLEINAELARLNKRMASGRLDVAGAAKVESDLAKVSDKLDELREKADKAKDHAVEDLDSVREHVSKLHEMVSKVAEGGGLLAKLLYGGVGKIGGAGDAESGPMGFLKILGSLSGSALGGGGIAFGIGAILTEVDGLVSGFAAAGAGVGAFAILAAPAFDKVKTAVTSLKADQLAYADATTKAARSSALKKIHDDWKALDPAERGAVKGVQHFMSTFDKMSKAFEPQAFKVFNEALKVANSLLPSLKPFADTAAKSLDGLLKQADKFTKSKGFKDWMKQFQKLEGPAITALGKGLGKVAIAAGKLLTKMSKKDVVHAINTAFKILAGTLNALGFIIQRVMLRWKQWKKWADQVTHAFDDVRHAVADLAHNIAAHFDEIRHDVADLGHNIASHFDEIRANIHRWADDVGRDATKVVNWFKALPGRIMNALSSLGSKLYAFGKRIISMLANGIRAAIGDVTGAIGSVVSEITSHLPFSPAKKGPLSGRGDPKLAGKRIAQMLADGMTDGASAVSHAADRMAGAASVGGHGGGGRPIQLEVRVPRTAMILGTDFWTAFQNGIRAKGGDPRIVQMKVVFQ